MSYDNKETNKVKVKNIEIKPLHSTSKTSFCWRYFGSLIIKDHDGKKRSVFPEHVFCSKCLENSKQINEDELFGRCSIKSYSNKVSSGNLLRHLKDDHKIQEQEKSVNVQQNLNAFFNVNRPTPTTSSPSTSAARKWLIARDLVLWVCKSLMPFDCVSDEAMLDFFLKYKVVCCKEDLPSRTTLSRTALDDVYQTMKLHVKGLIKTATSRFFAITTDLWSDSYKRLHYITITLHYIDSSLELQSFTLATPMIDGPKTGENIKAHILSIVVEFGLEEKEIIMVTDAGSNVKRAAILLSYKNHLCLGHGLHNLVTQDGIKNTSSINSIVTKCKKIVKSLRFRLPELQSEAELDQRRQLSNELDDVAEMLELDENDPISLTEDVIVDDIFELAHVDSGSIPTIKTSTPTRWNSVLIMLESLYHENNRKPIFELLGKVGKPELRICDSEWSILGGLISFLRRFKDITQILSASKTTTLNLALLFRCEIESALQTIEPNEALIIAKMKKNMLEKLNHRFPVDKLIVSAALLDCRFQGLKEIDIFLENQRHTRVSFLSKCIKDTIKSTDLHTQPLHVDESQNLPNSAKDTSAPKFSSDLLLALSKKHSNTEYDSTVESPIEVECWKYFGAADPRDLQNGDILSYWREKRHAFPWISTFAQSILSIPATSTPSERVFSIAGLTITAKRARLKHTNEDKIIFVHNNYEKCKQIFK